MTESHGLEPEPESDPAPPPRIEDERYCVGCGYELRGLRMDARCPECGTPVAQSLAGELLRYRPDRHLATLERGALVVQVTAIGQMAGVVLLVVVGVLFSVAVRQGAQPVANVLAAVAEWGGTALDLVAIAGWYLLSTPEPGYAGKDTGTKARRVVRIAVLASAAGSLLAVVLAGVLGTTSIPFAGGRVRGSAQPAELVSGIASVVAFFAQMVYLRWLARRIPDLKLEEDAKRFMWLGPVLVTVGWCVLVGPVVAWVMFVMMIARLRRDLRTVRWDRRTSGLETLVET